MTDSGARIAHLKEYAWREGDLSWKLHSTQELIDQTVKGNDAREILVLSTRQLGKSYWGTCYGIEYCLQNPGTIVRICAPTLKQVSDIVTDNLEPIARDAPAGLIQRQKSAYRWNIGKSSLRLGPLERAHVDANRGPRAGLIICEEGGFVSSDDYDYAIKSVLGPQVLRSSGRLVHITTPSEDTGHMLHTEILPKCALTGSLFRFTIYDNPQITEKQIEEAKELCGGEHTAAWRREYLAEIIRDPLLSLAPHFNENIHVRPLKYPEHAFYFIVIDFGGVRDRTVGLLCTYDFTSNKFLVFGERDFGPNTPTDEIIAGCRQLEAGLEIKQRYADCPGQLQVDLTRVGYPVQIPMKDDWLAGINNMQLVFTRNQILIDPSCKLLIQTLKSGRFNKQKTDFDRNSVLGHMDAAAALTYALRVIDKTNPYPHIIPHRETHFVRTPNPSSALEQVASQISPKVFGNANSSKKLGSFK